jgi:hypothetical protein
MFANLNFFQNTKTIARCHAGVIAFPDTEPETKRRSLILISRNLSRWKKVGNREKNIIAFKKKG